MAHLEHFYVEANAVTANELVLRDGEFHHAVRVRRKRVGDQITAVDGRGHLYQAVVTAIDRTTLHARIERTVVNFAEPRLRLTLAVGTLKGERMDWIVEKGSEIGIAAFQPIRTLRSVVQTPGRYSRWREKALAAMKQCGRSWCMDILPLRSLADLLDSWSGRSIFIAHEEAISAHDAEMEKRIKDGAEALLVVGPEGGFDDAEIHLAKQHGALLMYLGCRRLRSETAALVAAARLLTIAGDLG